MLNIAYVFPGQGSQSLGMLSDLAEKNPSIQETFGMVSEQLGYDLWDLVQKGPESTLNQTEYTQAAMLTADVAIYKLLMKKGFPEAKFMAGHSLGEYAALTCAGAVSLKDAAKLVTKRGQLMQKYVPFGKGAMAAIVGLEDEQVKALCSKSSQESDAVSPANFNALGQVVIAGHTSAVNRALVLAEDMGARLAKIIPVSVPCHCPLLMDAAEEFAEELEKTSFHRPDFAVISNVDLSIYQSISQIKTLLREQLYSPVRWVETIQQMKKNNVQLLIESGPGKVLSGLIKRIDKTLITKNVDDQLSMTQALEQVSNTIEAVAEAAI